MADRMQLVARELNRVQSVGEARAAIAAAEGELRVGYAAARGLSAFSVPSPEEASANLATLKGALAGELRTMSHRAAQDPVDPTSWPRTRRQIERTYIEVAGIEGTAGAVSRINVAGILGDAILGAPKVFGRAVGDVVGEVGSAAGSLGGGFLGGLGMPGILLLALVAGVLLLGRVR